MEPLNNAPARRQPPQQMLTNPIDLIANPENANLDILNQMMMNQQQQQNSGVGATIGSRP